MSISSLRYVYFNLLKNTFRNLTCTQTLHILLESASCDLCNEQAGSIIESVDSISRDERGFPLTQYITNARISRDRYTITHFKHHHRVLRLISNRMSV